VPSHKHIGVLIAFAVLLIVQAVIHLYLVDKIFVNDEGHYIVYAWLVGKGEVIYKDFFEHHPPLTTLLGVPFAILIGPSPEGFRLLSCVTMVTTTLIVFLISKKLYNEDIAVLSALAFILLEIIFFGFWFVAEPFIALALSLSILCALYSDSSSKPLQYMLASGFFAGAAFLLKPQAVIFIALVAAVLWKNSRNLRFPAAFLSGALAIFILATLYFAVNGAGTQFIYYGYLFTVFEGKGDFQKPTPSTLYESILVMFLAIFLAFSSFSMWSSKSIPSSTKLLLFTWLFSSLTFSFPRVDAFHFVPALPALAVLLLRKDMGAVYRGILIAGAVIGILLLLSVISAPFPDERILCDYSVAEYLAKHTTLDEKIFVAPFSPQIYAYANRGHVSRYPIHESWFMSTEIENEVINDLEENKPRYICYFNYTFDRGETMQDYAPNLYAYIQSNYRMEARFDECSAFIFSRYDAVGLPT